VGFTARVLDALFWVSAVVFSIGGMEIGGKLRLTYINDWWCACAVLFIIARLAFGVRLRDTSFGRAFVEMAEATLAVIGSRSIEPLKRLSIPAWLVLILCLYVTVLFVFLPVFTFWGYGNYVFDLGIIDNAIYNGAKAGKFFTRIMNGADGVPVNYFPNNRLNFGLFVFALIYKISDRTEYIFLLQSLFLLSALIPLYKLGDLILPKALPRWLPLLLYLFWDPIHRMNTWDFHETPFLIPFAFWALYFIEQRKLGWAFLHMSLMALWREDIWAVFSVMCIYAGIRTRRWAIAAPAAIVGAAVLPAFTHFFNMINTVGQRYAYLGTDIPAAFHTIVTKPWIFLQVLSSSENLKFFGRLFLRSGGGLFMFSGWAMLPSIPGIFEIGLSAFPPMMSYLNHYVGLFSAPLIYATLHGIARAYPRLENWKMGSGRTVIACSFAICFSQLSFSETGAFRMAIKQYRETRCLAELERLVPKDLLP
jgi:uncharacterized membrane protein